MKPDMIWNQYAARLTFAQDFLLGQPLPAEMKERYLNGYKVLTQGITADVFGRRRNPFLHLKPIYLDSPNEEGKKVLMRSSCCMYNCREGGELCYTCPKRTEKDRLEMKEKLAAAK
ncbi:hypothetical protein GCM10008018_28840 [Paenibacillus marchantiophytorum]|uniref:Ferric siderophore reductase C-terminal domain-containing protein n=1 Tax=Paenibacillus marchantiophytorum TaxID=1619310 RepID=A0ABQ1EPJ7_9BACL|nr:(2Fe-2S)-binding protein [Paenibacillus marchantiophytorum]GFZ81378.1 hypothetical protein GCM10008018_28840 [Paenibacillus marchantiophytorum]